MSYSFENLRHGCASRDWGYLSGGASASEPAAWACLALATHGDVDLANIPAGWLQEIQASDGSVGVSATQQRPAWPTSLAILAWNYLQRKSGKTTFQESIDRALSWSLHAQGKTAARQAEIGHDPMLKGWAWAEGTHSWLEPTAMFALALKSAGHWQHERTREAVRLIVDRLLPEGGCNYGNTMVLGQTLLPHVQPTGLAMMALAGEDPSDPRIAKSLDFLEDSLSGDSSVASLSYGLLGLAAHGRIVNQSSSWLANASGRASNGYQHALIALAGADHRDWLLGSGARMEVVAS